MGDKNRGVAWTHAVKVTSASSVLPDLDEGLLAHPVLDAADAHEAEVAAAAVIHRRPQRHELGQVVDQRRADHKRRRAALDVHAHVVAQDGPFRHLGPVPRIVLTARDAVAPLHFGGHRGRQREFSPGQSHEAQADACKQRVFGQHRPWEREQER